MARIFTVLIMIMGVVLATTAVWADSDFDIEVAKAKVILDKDKEVKQAEEKLKGLPDNKKAEESKKVDELKKSLEKATKAAWGKNTLDGLAYAQKVNQRKEFIDYLIANKAPKEDIDLALSDSERAVIKTTEQQDLQDKADQRFAGFGFGVALGVVGKAGKRDVIQSATLDPNGIVRVDGDANTTANLILESHYFFTPKETSFLYSADPKNWGHGPFVAIQPGIESIIEAVGAGWMVGFKRSSIVGQDLARDRGDSFNIGLGMMINPHAKVLGDGITKNQVLPVGETAVRLKTTTELGWLFVFSYSF